MGTKTQTVVNENVGEEMNSTTIRKKFNELEREINNAVYEREEMIRTCQIALLTKSNALFLGDPGTAKSYKIRLFAQSLGLDYFQYLLGKNMDPAELFGPVSMPEFKKGNFVRNTTNKLPQAQVAFLDETFKGSNSILNSLLTISNERLYDDGTGLNPVPLISLFGASNEMPQDETLGALYDRFLLRHHVNYMAEAGNFIKMLGNKHKVEITTRISYDELVFAQEQVETIDVPENVLKDIFNLKNELAKKGIHNSDRRWLQIMPLLRANAWLEGRDEVTSEDYVVFRHTLWTTLNQIELVRSMIDKLVDPDLDKARGVFNEMKAAYEALNSDDAASVLDTAQSFGNLRDHLNTIFKSSGGKVTVEDGPEGKQVNFVGGKATIKRMCEQAYLWTEEVKQRAYKEVKM